MLKRIGVNPPRRMRRNCCRTWKMRCGSPVSRPTRSSSR
jgi:hypothetical protein